MHIIGRGRYAREVYPESKLGAGALFNRNVTAMVQLGGVTPPTNPVGAPPLAALLFTPKVSGLIQVAMSINILNGANPESYGLGVRVLTGTGLSVTGGSVTDDGWVMGVPPSAPVIGGLPVPTQLLGEFNVNLLANQSGSLATFGVSPTPLPIGQPCVISGTLVEVAGGNPLASVTVIQLSAVEVPG